jgi:benzoyl-CoA reductase/2-hydroxyglutaryl-CoA dehydratase subunit BcrC/BadD/HgdB
MNFYEEYIIKLQKRIKRIDEDPDPTKLKSNKLRYEIELEKTQMQLDAWREGRPFSDGGSQTAANLALAMGFAPGSSVGPAMQTANPQKYFDRARAIGLPVEKSCDMTMMPFAMIECGDVPREDAAICDAHCCTPMMLRGIYVAHSSKTMTYYIDRGVEENEATLKYVTDQLGEFIEWAEKMFPGVIRYDEDKLIEMQSYTEASIPILNEISEMIKHKPSPVSGRGGGGGFGAQNAKGLELLRTRRDEIAERIEKGIAAVPGEKLRVIWAGVTNPIFMDPYKVLAKWGISTPLGLGGDPSGRTGGGIGFWGGRKLTPLEKVAARSMGDYRGGLGSVYVDEIVRSARNLQADAVIHYNMRGCTAALGLKKMLEDCLEKELGIPTLQLEGAQWDASYASEAQITSKLDEFAQMLLSLKGLN